MSHLSDLQSVVEKVRAERFPNLPASLVVEILAIESESVVNRATGIKKIHDAIEKHVEAHWSK